MKKTKVILLVCIILLIVCSLGFSQDWTATNNPFIPTNLPMTPNGDRRNGSDPSVRVIKNAEGNEELLLVTSCDIDLHGDTPEVGKYPMKSIFCYSTEDMIHWKDHGNIMDENDLDWAKHDADHMWAPNIHSGVAEGTDTPIYLLSLCALDKDNDAVQRIGFALSYDPYGSYRDNAFSEAITGINTGNNYYAYDPGMYCHQGEAWYMVYCDGNWPSGRLRIAKINNDLQSAVSGTDQKIEITGITDTHPKWYMEGPEVHKFNGKYYLIFALNKSDDGTNYSRGYFAYATKDDFEVGGPHTGWTYRGDIMDPNTHEWTNHGTIVEFKGQMYIFYHTTELKQGSFTEKYNGTNRRVCVEKFEFNTDGTIKDIPISQTPDGHGIWNNPQKYIHTLDEEFYSNQKSQPRIKLENKSNFTWTDFKAYYYFTVENGKTPVYEDYWTPNFTISLEHISDNQWAAVLDYDGTTLEPGEQVPASGDGDVFALRYTDNSYFDKSNDFSQPASNSYELTENIAVFDDKGTWIYGNKPEIEPGPVIQENKVKNQYSNKMLTVTNNSDYANVVCQSLNPSWTSQDWIMETVSGNVVRLKNLWSERYLTVISQNDCAQVVCQPLNTSWTSQEWIIEDVYNGSKRLKNVWSGKYLTVTSTSEYASILAQILNTGWTSQQWWIE